ncbi:MAG TPA: resuscitation-promoting factor Rpf1 domain-containing protein [Roseiarcus sp.]|nr:resuscitation-promoting factor Rpf1 domain-containing protein [Roseiarcus sp.]
MKILNPTRRDILALAVAAAAAAAAPQTLVGVSRAQEEAHREARNRNTAAFDEVWELVRDRFFDPRLHGVDWQATRAIFAPKAEAAGSREELAEAINAMLATLGASHTHFYTADEPAYYQLADIFHRALEHRGLQGIFPSGEVSYPGIGVFTHSDPDGRTFITGVIEGAPAEKAGVLLGDEIVSADGERFRPVGSFRNKVGASVYLAIRRARGDTPLTIAVVPAQLHPNDMFLQGLKSSARIITSSSVRIGYVHVWSYAGHMYQSAVEDLISEGPLREADALIWDLRDGWGGAQPRYLDLFNPRAPTMQVKARNGETDVVDAKWRKPVAALINGGTRSGKEVLAFGFKEYRIGELVGSRTEGAVLAATAFLIGNDGLLLLAVEDVLVDGMRLEGVGVTPTIEVAFDPRYAAGRDPQLERTVEILSRS